jgi:hypothetical protein
VNTDNQADHQVESPLIEPPRQAHNFAAGDVESLEEMPVAPGKRGGRAKKTPGPSPIVLSACGQSMHLSSPGKMHC